MCMMCISMHASLQFPEYDELYCNYSFVYGQDWAIVSVSAVVCVLEHVI